MVACISAFISVFDQMLDFHGIWADVMKRRYITVGFTGFVLMIPLAVTSTAGWIRRLGGKRWQMLHRLIYVTAIAGVIHFYWLVKSDVHVPLEYAAVMAILLGWRVYVWYTGPGRRTPAKSVAPKQPHDRSGRLDPAQYLPFLTPTARIDSQGISQEGPLFPPWLKRAPLIRKRSDFLIGWTESSRNIPSSAVSCPRSPCMTCELLCAGASSSPT